MTALGYCTIRGTDGSARFLARSLGRLFAPTVASAMGAALLALCLVGSAAGQGVPVPVPDDESGDVDAAEAETADQPLPAPIYLPPVIATPPVPQGAVSPVPPSIAPTTVLPPSVAPTSPPAGPADSASGHGNLGPAVTLSGRFALELADGTRLFGAPGGRTTVPFECVMGHVEVPMTNIRTIEFVDEQNGSRAHRVHFVNGDLVTGIVGPWPTVKFHTRYGELTVPLSSMVRMSAAPADVATNSGIAALAETSPTPPVKPQVQVPGPSVPVPLVDAAPGPIRRVGRIVPDDEVE